MISYGKQSIDQSDIDAVIEVLKSNWLTQGPLVEKFESDLIKYFGTSHCCVVSNGTAALHLTAMALGWNKDDIIITSPITFLASANCILYSKAIPSFVDIDPTSYTIDPNLVEEKIKYYQSKGKNVKAIIGVDYAGHPCDWKALRQIADKYNIQLVNDNCHSLGASYSNDKQYSGKYADVITQSYHPVKHITTGEGGAILTNNIDIDEKVKSLRTHGITKDKKHLMKNDGIWYYEMYELGYNYRLSDLQCALGSSQLKRLDKFIKTRREIAKVYDKAFLNNNMITPKVGKGVNHSYHLYPLQVDFENHKITKSNFFEKMLEIGINLQVHYIPVHLQPYYKFNYGFKDGDFPISENFYKNEISLPIYPDLSNDDLKFVVKNILEILNK